MASAGDGRGELRSSDDRLFESICRMVPERLAVERRTLSGTPSAFAGGQPAFLVFGGAVAVRLPIHGAEALVNEGLGHWLPIGPAMPRSWVALDPKAVPRRSLKAAVLEAVEHAEEGP